MTKSQSEAGFKKTPTTKLFPANKSSHSSTRRRPRCKRVAHRLVDRLKGGATFHLETMLFILFTKSADVDMRLVSLVAVPSRFKLSVKLLNTLTKYSGRRLKTFRTQMENFNFTCTQRGYSEKWKTVNGRLHISDQCFTFDWFIKWMRRKPFVSYTFYRRYFS